MNNMKRAAISMTIAMAFGTGMAQAAYTPVVTTTGNNFTMVGVTNGLIGGNNTTTFTWDGTYRNAVVADGSYNATLSSPNLFAGKPWVTHNLNIYAPGNYTFYTTCPTGNPACGVGSAYNMTVGTGQVGAHMLLDWSGQTNIDIVLLWDMNKSWAQTGTTSPFSTASNPNGNTMNTVWNGVSTDTNMDADNYSGTAMLDGPFIGMGINYNINGIHAAPVPPSIWLLGSGLLGLIGVVRRKAT